MRRLAASTPQMNAIRIRLLKGPTVSRDHMTLRQAL